MMLRNVSVPPGEVFGGQTRCPKEFQMSLKICLISAGVINLIN